MLNAVKADAGGTGHADAVPLDREPRTWYCLETLLPSSSYSLLSSSSSSYIVNCCDGGGIREKIPGCVPWSICTGICMIRGTTRSPLATDVGND